MAMYTLDTVPSNAFQKKIAIGAMGGYFTIGYMLGIIAFALPMLTPELNVDAYWQGLIGASPLIGIFLGSFLGALGDKVGRKYFYRYVYVVVAVASVLQYVAADAGFIFAMRLIIGLCIGIEYPVTPAMLIESTSEKTRARTMSFLMTAWCAGYVVATVVGWVVSMGDPSGWRPLLASSAVVAIIVLVFRYDAPESPRWLATHGRLDEANEIIAKYYGDDVEIGDVQTQAGDEEATGSYALLFKNGMWKKTLFAALQWLAGVVPLYGVLTFLPTVMVATGVEDGSAATVGIYSMMLVAAIIMNVIINMASRKTMLIALLVLNVVPMFILGMFTDLSPMIIVVLFAVFVLCNTILGILTSAIIPPETFPTDIRTQGLGLCTALSRVGAAFATFIMPVLMADMGVSVVLIGMGVFLLVCLVAGVLWKPTVNQ